MAHQEEGLVTNVTPYEKFLREAIQEKKKELDALYDEFAHANRFRKQAIKRRIDQVSQNIDITSKDLDKFMSGVSWLREPTKERDEKAEKLKEVPVDEEKASALAAKPTQTAAPAVAKPATPVAKPVGGQPTATPSASTPLRSPSTSTPVVGTPKPSIASTPKPEETKPAQKAEDKKPSEEKKDSA